ncbi:hypothetical protein BH23CHL10_BH23CHL10_10550 [soil metagenome]
MADAVAVAAAEEPAEELGVALSGLFVALTLIADGSAAVPTHADSTRLAESIAARIAETDRRFIRANIDKVRDPQCASENTRTRVRVFSVEHTHGTCRGDSWLLTA